MEQIRFNPFHQVHQALRALLYHVSLSVQHTDFANQAQSEKTLSLVEQMVLFFDGHAHTEDSLVFPMIAAISPGVVEDFEAQHEKDHALGEALSAAVKDCRSATGLVARHRAGRELQRTLTEFCAFNLSHMNQEETRVLSILHENFSDDDLYAKEMEIVASLSREKKQLSGFWMLRGLATFEIVEWYKKIKSSAPPFVFAEYMQLAESALTTDKLNCLQDALACA